MLECQLGTIPSTMRSKEKFESLLAENPEAAVLVESQGVKATYPVYSVFKENEVSFFTYTRVLLSGNACFWHSLDILTLDDGKKYVFICAIVLKSEDGSVISIMIYLVNPIEKFFEGSAVDMNTLVINAKDFQPSSVVK